MSVQEDITNTQIAETIVRTAYSRVYDCLLVLKDQNSNADVIQLAEPAQNRMINMLIQDFSSAHSPCNGSSPLRHASPTDKPRDLAVASKFNQLQPNIQKAIAKSAFRQLVGNISKSPIMSGIDFKF